MTASGEHAGRRIRVAFVGGLERLERQVVLHGAELGLEVEWHNGHVWGGGAARLASLIPRVDHVVIVTGTNSHNAVRIARREATRFNVPLRIVKFLGSHSARAILQQIAEPDAA